MDRLFVKKSSSARSRPSASEKRMMGSRESDEDLRARLDEIMRSAPLIERSIVIDEMVKLARGRVGKVLRAVALWSLCLSGTPQESQSDRGWADVLQLPETKAAREEHLPTPREMYTYLREQFGDAELQRLLPEAETDPDQWESRQRMEEREPRVEVTGAELIGLRNEDLQRYIVAGFPRVFTGRTSVTHVRVTSERIPMPVEYGIPGYEGGHCTVSPGGASSEIVVTLESLNGIVDATGTRLVLTAVVPHELIHAASPLNAASMDPRTRLEVLYLATKRVLSAHPLQFSEVTLTRNRDPRRQLSMKVGEYIAETGRAMFGYRLSHVRDPQGRLSWQQAMATRLAQEYHSTPEEALQDVRMIERVVGPNFDWEAAAETREQVLHAALLERSRVRLRGPVTELSDPALRDALMQAMEAPRAGMSDVYMAMALSEHDLEEDLAKAIPVQRESLDARLARERSTVRQVTAFREHEVTRLRSELPLAAQGAFETWIQAVDRLREARLHMWHPREEDAAVQTAAGMLGHAIRRFNEMGHGHSPHVRQACLRYLRIAGYGELTLPEPLAAQARRMNRESLDF